VRLPAQSEGSTSTRNEAVSYVSMRRRSEMDPGPVSLTPFENGRYSCEVCPPFSMRIRTLQQQETSQGPGRRVKVGDATGGKKATVAAHETSSHTGR